VEILALARASWRQGRFVTSEGAHQTLPDIRLNNDLQPFLPVHVSGHPSQMWKETITKLLQQQYPTKSSHVLCTGAEVCDSAWLRNVTSRVMESAHLPAEHS